MQHPHVKVAATRHDAPTSALPTVLLARIRPPLALVNARLAMCSGHRCGRQRILPVRHAHAASPRARASEHGRDARGSGRCGLGRVAQASRLRGGVRR
eukprot:365067-Chlamydomonas_euryale.AAC.35